MRRKGELAWAIRLGQNMLLSRSSIPRSGDGPASSWGLDYRRAGMQDRARETFEALVADAPVQPEALVAFRRLLEESHDWARAVEIEELLLQERGAGTPSSRTCSHSSRSPPCPRTRARRGRWPSAPPR